MRLLIATATCYFLASLLSANVSAYALLPIALYVFTSKFRYGALLTISAYILFLTVRATALFDSMRALFNEGILAAAKWGYMLPLQQTEHDATLAVSLLLLICFMRCTKKHLIALLMTVTLLPAVLQLDYPIIAYTAVVTACIVAYSKLHANTYVTSAALTAMLLLLACSILPQLSVFQSIGDVLEQRKAYIIDGQHHDAILTNGDFSHIDPFERNGVAAFTLTMNTPRPMYLKSYVGTTYDNGWVHHAEDALPYEAIDAKLATTQFAHTQFAAAAESATETLVIEPLNISQKQLLIPYELVTLPENAHANESTVTLRGTDSYSYRISSTAYNTYRTVASKLYTNASSDYLQREALHNYRSYAQYTELPQDVRTLLANHVELSPHTSYEETIAFVQRSMSLLAYNESASLRNEDVLSYMLEQSKEGYSVHYATLATLLFRAVGVPARYVEGYIITNDDASSSTMTITSDNRHAWTEIYIDYIGWIPVEVTPNYAVKMPALTDTTYEQLSAPQTSTAPLPDVAPNVSHVKPPTFEEQPTTEVEDKGTYWSWLLFLLLIPLAVIAIRLYKHYRRIDVRFMKLISRYNKQMKTSLPTHRVIAAINSAEANELYALYNAHQYNNGLSNEQLSRIRAVQTIVAKQLRTQLKMEKRAHR